MKTNKGLSLGGLRKEVNSIAYKIIAEKCIQCDACRLECPRNAITNADNESTYVIDQEKCNDCANMSTVRCHHG